MTNPTQTAPNPTRAAALHALLTLKPEFLAERLRAHGEFSAEDEAQLLATKGAARVAYFADPIGAYRAAQLHELELPEHEEAGSRIESALIRHVVAQSLLRVARQEANGQLTRHNHENGTPRFIEDRRAYDLERDVLAAQVDALSTDLQEAEALARAEIYELLDDGEYLPFGVPLLLRARNTGGAHIKVTVDPENKRFLSF